MIRATLDTRNFDKAMSEYAKFTSKAPDDMINSTLYFISRNASRTTKHSDKGKIRSELEGPAKIGGVLGGILVNAKLGKQNIKGLYGPKMKREVEKLIRKRNSSLNYVRAGWKNAIKSLEAELRRSGELNRARRSMGGFSSEDNAAIRKKMPADSGFASVARGNRQTAIGEIANNAGTKDTSSLTEIKTRGLQNAINQEEQSKWRYIEKKMNEAADKFNR